MSKDTLQPLDKIYRLEENAEWKHFLNHLRMLEGFGLLIVLAPEQAGVEVCRRALHRHFAEQGQALLSIHLHLHEPADTLGDQLLQATPSKDTGALWISAPEAETTTHEESMCQLWRDALAALNPRRNPLRRHLHVPLIFAAPLWLQEVCREAAPDLWSIRDTVARIEPVDRYLSPGGNLQANSYLLQEERPTAGGDPEETRQSLVRLDQKVIPESETANLELLKVRLLHRLGRQLWRRYQWTEAEMALLEAEQIVERHHQCLDDQADLLFDLGQFFQERGEYMRAEHYARKAYEFSNAHFGIADRNTLESRNKLANILDDQGKYTDAERQHRAVLSIRERVLGGEHPDTLSSRNNLANTLYAQGKFSEVEREIRTRISIEERVLGAEHPEALRSRSNLANALYAQGKYSEAEREDRSRISIESRVFGSEHLETLRSRENLALTLSTQGKYFDAENEHRTVLALFERILGVEHPDVIRTCYNLAVCLKDQNKLTEALNFAQRAERGWKRILGEDHPYYKSAIKLREQIESSLDQK